MAFVSIKSAKPGEDVVIVTVDSKLRNEQQLRLNTSGLDGLNPQQITAAMKVRESNLPDDVYFRRNANGSVDVATGAEPDWDELDRIAALAAAGGGRRQPAAGGA